VQVLEQGGVTPVDVGVGIVGITAAVQLGELGQRGDAGVVVAHQGGQARRVAVDAARAAHRRQELELLDFGLPPPGAGSAAALPQQALPHAEEEEGEYINKY